MRCSVPGFTQNEGATSLRLSCKVRLPLFDKGSCPRKGAEGMKSPLLGSLPDRPFFPFICFSQRPLTRSVIFGKLMI